MLSRVGRFAFHFGAILNMTCLGSAPERSGVEEFIFAGVQTRSFLDAYLLSGWHLDPYALATVCPLVAFYWIGHARMLRTIGNPAVRAGYERRSAAMIVAMFFLVVGLFSPVETWAMVYQWVHMIWHLDLMVAAPPFLILADPWHEIRMGLPRAVDRALTLGYRRLAALPVAATAGRLLTSPWIAVVGFDAAMWGWHIPGPFDWAMASQARMEIMMFSFFTTGMMMWYVAIDPNPNRRHEGPILRVFHMMIVSMSCMLLSVMLGLSSGPWYSAYNALMGTVRTLPLLADQQIAAGILWVFGAVPWFIAGVVTLRDWLNDDERGGADITDAFRVFTLRHVRSSAGSARY